MRSVNASKTTFAAPLRAACLVAMMAFLHVAAAAAVPELSYRELAPKPLGPTVPGDFFDVELVFDDGSAEGAFGVGGLSARQFLWFHVFDGPRDYDLEEIWVLFPDDPQIVPGAPIQLVVYQDDDDDPSSGAELLLSSGETVQVADGSTFSIYALTEPLELRGGGTTLLGVVNRFAMSGVSPASQPAALDTGVSQQRSWVALWSGDPPAIPELPPDDSLFMIDDFVAGNWMIRGFGEDAAVVDIPTLGARGLSLLALFLGAVAWRRLIALGK